MDGWNIPGRHMPVVPALQGPKSQRGPVGHTHRQQVAMA